LLTVVISLKILILSPELRIKEGISEIKLLP